MFESKKILSSNNDRDRSSDLIRLTSTNPTIRPDF